LEARIALNHAEHVAHWQRVQLLDAADRDVRGGRARLVRQEIDGDLAAAENEPAHVACARPRLRVVDHLTPLSFRQLTWGGRDERVAQQTLWREHDERQRVLLEERRLPPQQMEELRSRRAVGDAHVDVRGELQKSFGAGAGVIWPLAFVAMR